MSKKLAKQHYDAMLAHAVPSQIPINVTRTSFARMLKHTTVENGMWYCSKTNAKIEAKMWKRTVYDRETNRISAVDIPVAVIYCSGCDKPPKAKAHEPIFADEIQTISA